MPDTYISQFSGEEIDSALRAAQIISGADTPAELRKKLEIRGDTIPVSATDPTPISEALTASGGGINPNLLDNWFFGRPVNQRGQTEYTAVGYTVDRWKLLQWNTDEVAAKLKKTGLNISGSAEGKANSTYIEENIDFPFAGKTVTISAIISEINKNSNTLSLFLRANNTLLHSHPIKSTGLVSTTYTFANDFDGIVGFEIGQGGSEGGLGSCDFTTLAAKLELGDTQTLAHKENEKWVLNEIPDFGEQLRRCQRHAFSPLYEAYATAIICNLFISSTANGVAFGEVTLPVSMRNKPIFSGDASKFWIVAENGGGASHPTAISVMGLSADKVMIQVNGSYTANTQYILYAENPFTSADFLLSADL